MASSLLLLLLLLLFIFSFFNLASLTTLLSAQHPDSHCPAKFPCEPLGEFGFPFTNQTYPHCGLFLIDCTTTTTTHVVLNPRVQFLNSDRWYHIKSLNYSGNEIVIHDQYLQEQLDSNTCNSLDNITIPESSALKFTTPIAPFYRCKCNESKSFDDHSSEFTAPIYNYSGCDDSYDLYFSKDPAAGESLPSLPETLIDLCSTFWLPRIPGWDPTKKGLASLFTACFYLRWEILPVCQNCTNKLGGQCTDNNGTFNCVDSNNAILTTSKLD